ncbi:MAG: SprT family zinc-dependent metalloprotease [Candidatus Firestonebacteria bacterium]
MNTDKTYKLHISNLTIDVVKKSIKNMHLGVYPPAGRVRIAAPFRISDEAVRLFAVSKIAWIRKQKTKFEDQPRQEKREYVSGESHYFLGKRYLLNVFYHNATSNVVIKNKERICLYAKKNNTIKHRDAIFNEWYRKQLKRLVPERIQKWQNITGIKINDWKIKRMRTRWGTCNYKSRRIWLNLELAKKPLHCLDFIILHEMVHLLEKNHGDRFKSLMGKFMLRWQLYKDELNKSILSHEKWVY